MISGSFRSDIRSPEVVKIPAPIMLAITMLVTGKSPSFLSSPLSILVSFIVPYLQDAISFYPI
jgi:hypothetical protein